MFKKYGRVVVQYESELSNFGPIFGLEIQTSGRWRDICYTCQIIPNMEQFGDVRRCRVLILYLSAAPRFAKSSN